MLPMGSNEFACGTAAPFPDSTEDVSMESGVDKRSRESPDSTLKPEGKSLKTSESAAVAADMDTCAATSDAPVAGSMKPSNVTKRPKTIPEAKFLMWEVHQRMPAWKAVKLIESNKDDQVDLAALGEATGILFDSREMLNEAVQCLERIRKEKDGKEDDKSKEHQSSDPCSAQDDEQEVSDDSGSDDPEGEEESHGHLKQMHRRNKITQVMQAVLANLTKSRLPKNQRTVTSSKMPLHPAAIQRQRKRPNLCQSRMKLGLIVSQVQDRMSCGIQRPQLCVLHS